MAAPVSYVDLDWQSGGRAPRQFSWRSIFWLLVFPQSGQRTGLTTSGALLIALSMAIGVAAYNSSSNILFLTLSLLLGCLILSGVLSWLNFRGLRWRLEVESPLRVGIEHPMTLAVRNEKLFLPTYGVSFELELVGNGNTFPLTLARRLDARQEVRLSTAVRPLQRGRDFLRLIGVGSAFPFGFLRKSLPAFAEREVVIWPAVIEYRRIDSAIWEHSATGETQRRLGQSGDLLALRRYQQGDSLRQIHWKASARLRHLMVRQHAAESGENFSLWVDLSAERWPKSEQFELLCSFAASLAEDLYKLGRLRSAAVGADALVPIRKLRDLEWFLDRLAIAQPTVKPASAQAGGKMPAHNLLTFAPEGTRGISAYVNGERTATT